jgi:UrcA family protein
MEKRNLKSNLPAIAFACAALIAAVPSSALAQDEIRTQRVPYGDLDLASQPGIDTLDRRLDRAVEKVCSQPGPRNLQQQRMVAQCEKQTRQKIQAKRDLAIAQTAGNRGHAWAENGFRGSEPTRAK